MEVESYIINTEGTDFYRPYINAHEYDNINETRSSNKLRQAFETCLTIASTGMPPGKPGNSQGYPIYHIVKCHSLTTIR